MPFSRPIGELCNMIVVGNFSERRRCLSRFLFRSNRECKACGVALGLLLVLGQTEAAIAQTKNVQDAVDVIVMFCVAGGEKFEVSGTGKGDGGLELKKEGKPSSADITISKSEARGLVDGLRREMSNVTANQASEARKCMQPYIERILDTLLGKASGTSPSTHGDVAFGEIFIEWPPSPSPCTVNYRIEIADQHIVPQGPYYRVPNIRLGPTTWTIKGIVRCSDGTFCESPGSAQSGQLNLRFGGTYRFFWNVVPKAQGGECYFSLVG
jgi:hypothetical protein